MKREKILYSFNGEDGVLSEAIKLHDKGFEVDLHASCRIGAGCYVLVWHEEDIEKEDSTKQPELVIEDESSSGDTSEVVEKNSPDWEYAKSLSPDKDALEVYAIKYGIDLDKRKGFTSMLKSFQGKWNSVK